MWKPCLEASRTGVALAALLWGPVVLAQSCDDRNTVVADVVAIDMPMVFNRLGAQNVNWQMYALRHDLVVRSPGQPARPVTDADFADGFALKYFGAVRLTRAAWPHLKAASGSVLFISGVGGRTPGAQFTIGGSVNAALLSFTKALAELGVRDGVQVNAINPGTIRTERMKARLKSPEDEAAFIRDSKVTRIGETRDIAALATFLVSDEGRFLHGSLIDADGGATKTI